MPRQPRPEAEKLIQTSYYAPPHLLEALRALADLHRRSMSSELSYLIEEYLRTHPDDAQAIAWKERGA